jgi:4-amino-4-deoxy-L-arabinose transferase-like glycosyltransferase
MTSSRSLISDAEFGRSAAATTAGERREELGAVTWWWLALAGSLGLGLLSLWLRPLLPVDETRYLTVAWEMWDRGSFLLPSLNGELYEHKPPLLFWLIHAGWAVAGVGETWPRLIGPLSTLASAWLLSRLGARLWPQSPQAGRFGGLMFLGSVFVAFYGTALMFDLPLLVFVCLGWLALHDAGTQGRWRDWLGYGLAFAAAMLTKGPVAMVYLLPPLLAWRLWAPLPFRSRAAWRVTAALAIAIALPLAWLLLADRESQGELLRRVLLEQTLGRVQGDLGHPRPLYWYLPFLPLMALPWTLWPRAWRALGGLWRQRDDRGLRLVAAIGVPGFVLLSAVGGKQVHYLLPLLALGLLALARGLHGAVAPRQLVRRTQFGLAAIAVVMVAGFALLAPRYDLAAAGRHVGDEQRAGRETAYVGNYQGEFGYYGRLRAPVRELTPAQARDWVRTFPDGLVIARRKRLVLHGAPPPEFRQRYKTDELLMFRAGDLVASGSGFREPGRVSGP